MSNRFDTALVNREQTRILLSEALDSKYEQEARRRMVARLMVFAMLAGVGYLVLKGTAALNALFHPPMTAQKRAAPDPSILAQMKKQMADGDPLLIGGEPTPAATGPRRTHGGPADFAPEKIPINLYSELSRPPPAGGGKKPYDPPGARAQREIEELGARAARRPPIDYGKYRPGEARDFPKIPPPHVPHAPPPAALYAHLAAPPAALANDDREFPREK